MNVQVHLFRLLLVLGLLAGLGRASRTTLVPPERPEVSGQESVPSAVHQFGQRPAPVGLPKEVPPQVASTLAAKAAPSKEQISAMPAVITPAVGGGPAAYVMRDRNVGAFFTGQGVSLGMEGKDGQGWGLEWGLVGALATPPRAEGELPGRVNYFRGDSSQWKTDLPTYSRIVYDSPLPGIDMIVESRPHGFKYTLHMAPGADPGALRFRYEGAGALHVVEEGAALEVITGVGTIRESGLQCYQDAPEGRREVLARYRAVGLDEVAIELGASDPDLPVVIDPVIGWGSFLGGAVSPNGAADEVGYGIAVDATGNVYVTGTTLSVNFATTGGFDTSLGGSTQDAFVTKLNPGGTNVIWSSYLGGTLSSDFGYAVAVDASQNVYVTGYTLSSDFPTTPGAFDTVYNFYDVFVTKVAAAGTGLVYSTFIGGTSDDYGYDIAVDGSGRAHVTGYTWSTNFPVLNGVDLTSNGGSDTFVTRVAADGASLEWSTYLGGSSSDYGRSLALDGSGNVYVTGYTFSTNFPFTAGAFRTVSGGSYDAFVTKINSAGTTLGYSTYLGGSSDDLAQEIAVDGGGNAFVTGYTYSANYPVSVNAYDTTYASVDAFITSVNATGTALTWSTFLGGTSTEIGNGIAVDSTGKVYVTGYTFSTPAMGFPAVGGFDLILNSQDGYVVKFDPALVGLAQVVWSTYLGGLSTDTGADIAVDGAGNAYVTGDTYSTDFPTTAGAFDLTLGNTRDAFVTKINPSGLPSLVWSTYLGGSLNANGNDDGVAMAVDSSGDVYVGGNTVSSDFPTSIGAYDTLLWGNRDAFLTKVSGAGTGVVWSSYLGGSGIDDYITAIALDSSNNVYCTGYTLSTDFPTFPAGAFDVTANGGYEAFVTKFNSTGSALVYSTFLGSTSTDYGYAIAVDSSGQASVAGVTYSAGFPVTPGAFDTAISTTPDGFVTRLNATGTSLLWSTFMGGTGTDFPYAVAADGSGNVYVTGYTTAASFPTTAGAYDVTWNGSNDAFVTKINAGGATLGWSTFLGGASADIGRALVVDGAGNVTVTGETFSTNFPTSVGAYDTTNGGSYDLFVTTVNPTGTGLGFSTFIGGASTDYPRAIARDASGNIYITGYTYSLDFPLKGAFDSTLASPDAFVTKLYASGAALGWSSYLGGSSTDYGYGIGLVGDYVYVTGTTYSTDFPATLGFDTTLNGQYDVFVVRLDSAAPPSPASPTQLRLNGSTVIPTGGWTNESSVILRGTISDSDDNNVKMQVEIRPVTVDFLGTANYETGFLPSGSLASVTVAGLVAGTEYHWQARAVDSTARVSGWVAYGGNADLPLPAARDLGYDSLQPTVMIQTPVATPNYSTNSAFINLTGNSSDLHAGVTSVTWINGTTGTSGVAIGTLSWSIFSIPLVLGYNPIIVVAGDGAGNAIADTIVVTYDTTVPGIAVTQPTMAPSYVTAAPSIILSGSISDNWNVLGATWVNSGGGSGAVTIPPPPPPPVDIVAPATVSDLQARATSASSVALQWTAPGDDGSTGTATIFDLRYATTGPITAGSWAGATRVFAPVPLIAGTLQQVSVSGLTTATTYWFAIQAQDEAGNLSGISNSPSDTTLAGATGTWGPDGFGYVARLAGSGGLPYSWETPGVWTTIWTGVTLDDSFAGPFSLGFSFPFYGVNYIEAYAGSNGYITFGSGTGTINPSIPSTLYNIVQAVSGDRYVTAGTTVVRCASLISPTRWVVEYSNLRTFPNVDPNFTFQIVLYATGEIKVQYSFVGGPTSTNNGIDDTGANGLSVGSWAVVGEAVTYSVGGGDTAAPADISDLSVRPSGTTGASLLWTAPGDDTTSGIAAAYEVRYSAAGPITLANWASATIARGQPFPVAPGGTQAMTVWGLNPASIYWFAVRTRDEVNNWSGVSNSPSVATGAQGWSPVGGSGSGGGISGTAGSSTMVSLALDATGNPVVAWSEAGEIYLRRWTGAAWAELGGSATGGGISGSPVQPSFLPSVALDATANPAVAWNENGNIHVRRWNGTGWAALGTSAIGNGISTAGGVSAGLSLALDGTGNPAVAWEEAGEIYLRRWTGAVWAELGGSATGGGISGTAGASITPSLSLDGAGNPVVAWEEAGEIYLRRWTGAVWADLGGSPNVSGTAGASTTPALALDVGGNPAVAWVEADEIYLRSWNGSAWAELGGSATGGGISGTTGVSAGPSLALTDAGTPIVAWRDGTSGNNEIFLRLWDGVSWTALSGSASGGAISGNEGLSAAPALRLDGSGYPVVAWQDATAGNNEIYLRRWAPAWSTTVALAPGVNTITFTVTDEAGNTSTDIITVIRDLVGPAVAFTAPPTSPFVTAALSVTISGTAADTYSGVSSVTWVNDRGGSGPATGATSWTQTSVPLAGGTNIITVTATDGVGNTGSANHTVIRDVTPPTILITIPVLATTYTTGAATVTLGGTASDDINISDVWWFNPTTGGSGPATGTTSWTASSIGLNGGVNQIDVRVRDGVLNESWDTIFVTYDTFSPTVVITGPTSALTYLTPLTTVDLAGTASDQAPGFIQEVTWLNSATSFSGTAVGTTSWTISSIVLNPGDNVIAVTATDDGGLPTTVTLTVFSDVSAPSVMITVPASSSTFLTNASPLTLEGTAGDNYGLAQVTWLNAANAAMGTASGTNPWTASSIPLVPDANPITVTAYDSAGNFSSDLITVTYDIVPPSVAISNPTSAPVYSTLLASVPLGGTASDVYGLSSSVFWSNSATGASGTATGTGSWSVASVALVPGPNLITVFATDLAGNTRTDTITVNQDTAAPTLMITAPTLGTTYVTSAVSIALGGTASDDVGVAGVSWVNSAGGFGPATGTSSWSVPSIILAAGSNVITVTAADALGATGSDILTVIQDSTAPTLAITPPAASTTSLTPITLAGTASDNVTLVDVVWRNNATAGTGAAAVNMGPVPPEWSASISLTPGANLIEFTARDSAGNTFTGSIVITYDPASPTVEINSPTTEPSLTTPTASLALGGGAADDVGVVDVTWVSSRGSSGTAALTGLVTSPSWSATITLLEGANVITVTSRDGVGRAATDEINAVYDSTPPAVTITNPLTAVYSTSGSPFSLKAEVTDAVAVSTVSWSNTATGASGSMTQGAGDWSAGVPLVSGSQTVNVIATDSVGNVGMSSVDIVYDATNPTIVILTPASSPFATSTRPFVLDGQASDNLVVNAVTWVNNRGGGGTATLMGPVATPMWTASVYLYSGLNVITVTVVDDLSNMGTAQTTIDFTPEPVPPSVTINDLSAAVSSIPPALTMSGTADDNVGVVRVEWLNQATGVSGDATGLASWSVTVPLTEGVNLIVITATDDAGNSASDTYAATYTSPPDTDSPIVSFSQPTTGPIWTSVLSPLPIELSAMDTTVGISKVSWLNKGTGGDGIATPGASPFWTDSVALVFGSNEIEVTATDPLGNTGTATLLVNFSPPPGDLVLPTVLITSHAVGTTVVLSTPVINIAGTSSDNQAVTTVTWKNSATGRSGAVSGVDNWTQAVLLAPGINVIDVAAFDSSGNKSFVTLVVIYEPPAPPPPVAEVVSAGHQCGSVGVDLLLPLGLLWLLRRARRRRGV